MKKNNIEKFQRKISPENKLWKKLSNFILGSNSPASTSGHPHHPHGVSFRRQHSTTDSTDDTEEEDEQEKAVRATTTRSKRKGKKKVILTI